MSHYRILTLNQISPHGLHRFPGERYTVGKAVDDPDAIIVRSHDMHAMAIPASVKAIGRAGAGTNNIPVAEMSKRGAPVFNAPGANANAVKELVLTAMLMAARNVVPALRYVATLDPADRELEARVEEGKKQFAGFELPHRTLGHHRARRDRQPRRRHGDQARHESDRLRPRDHRRRRVAPAFVGAQGELDRGGAAPRGLRVAARSAAARHAAT